MKIPKDKDILGKSSAGLLFLLIAASLGLYIWAVSSGPGGHPSNDIIAAILVIFMAILIAPAGAAIGAAGLLWHYKRFRNFRSVWSIIGIFFNLVIFLIGLFFYLKFLK